MNTPITLALLALVTGGMARFAWKIAGTDSSAYGPSYMVVETVAFVSVAIVIHLIQRHPFELSPKMTGLALVGGTLAGITVFSVILAFRLGGQGIVIYPIAGISVIVAVLLSSVFYREPVTLTKFIGLGLGVSSIIVLSR